jgi:hypothetical protein
MNHRYIAGGQLAWGIDHVPANLIDGKEMERSPRFIHHWHPGLHSLYYLRRSRSRKFAVINFTSRWFSVGVTTSGGAGFTIATEDTTRRGGSEEGDTHRWFNGAFMQLGFYWFKFYCYFYANGDGLGHQTSTFWSRFREARIKLRQIQQENGGRWFRIVSSLHFYLSIVVASCLSQKNLYRYTQWLRRFILRNG